MDQEIVLNLVNNVREEIIKKAIVMVVVPHGVQVEAEVMFGVAMVEILVGIMAGEAPKINK